MELSEHLKVRQSFEVGDDTLSNYEPGMVLCYDHVTKGLVIDFREQIDLLIGPFNQKADAIAAGEVRCRELGWLSGKPREVTHAPHLD